MGIKYRSVFYVSIFPGDSDRKASAYNAGDLGSVPGLGRFPGGRQPTPVFLPGESMDRRAWEATVHGVEKSQTQLSDFPFAFHLHSKITILKV